MPNGSTVVGPEELRVALLARPNNFVQGLTQRLLIYALGRPLDARDMPTVRQIVRESASEDYRFEALVTGIIRTSLFRKNTVPLPEVGTAPAVASTATNNAVQ